MSERNLSVPLAVMLLGLLTSCGRSPEVIHILTDRKELAPAVEIFDASHPDLIVTMHHVPAIDSTLIEAEEPDLVIGANLSAPEISELMQSSDWEGSDYPVINGPRDSRGRLYTRALAFELPLIMGKAETMERLPDASTVRPEELRAAAAKLNTTDRENRLTRLGFSPAWDSQTYVDLWALRFPRAMEGGVENISEADLDEVVEEAASWILESSGGPEPDAQFSEKYRYIPDERLIEEGRILFARTDFASWAAYPDQTRQDLDFRYFRGDRTIPVVNVISAGISRSSSAQKAAESFIDWLSLPETQTALMARWERDNIVVFGFLGGLSAKEEVNRSDMQKLFPVLEGKIPESDFLDSPEEFPHRWSRIRREVMAPWFSSEVENRALAMEQESETVPGRSLVETYRTWDLSSLVESD